jgi:hypothetical protein
MGVKILVIGAKILVMGAKILAIGVKIFVIGVKILVMGAKIFIIIALEIHVNDLIFNNNIIFVEITKTPTRLDKYAFSSEFAMDVYHLLFCWFVSIWV